MAAQRPNDRVQSRLIQVIERPSALHPIGELIERCLFLHSTREGLLCALTITNVVLDANRVEETSLRIANALGSDRCPKIVAVPSADSLFNTVSVDLSGYL